MLRAVYIVDLCSVIKKQRNGTINKRRNGGS